MAVWKELACVPLKILRNAGLPNGCYLLQLSLTMSDATHLPTWVTRETKERFAAVAGHQGLSDSALLKRLVDLMLQSASAAEVGTPGGADRTSRDSRLTVRIRPDDQLFLRERAASRGMAAATYVWKKSCRNSASWAEISIRSPGPPTGESGYAIQGRTSFEPC
jgi:hypothetical protein